jgi:hypothetical protein
LSFFLPFYLSQLGKKDKKLEARADVSMRDSKEQYFCDAAAATNHHPIYTLLNNPPEDEDEDFIIHIGSCMRDIRSSPGNIRTGRGM